jgi:hypothetical protein
MTDLLEIPPFLRRGTPECDKARAENAARLKANPELGPRAPRPPAITRIAPTKAARKRAARARSDVYRQQLIKAGYPTGRVKSLSLTKAKELVAKIIAGEPVRKDLI